MLYKAFKTMYNSVWNPKNYNTYIGRKYSYGTQIITIVGLYTSSDGKSYFETNENSCCRTMRHIPSFLEDVANGIYKEVK